MHNQNNESVSIKYPHIDKHCIAVHRHLKAQGYSRTSENSQSHLIEHKGSMFANIMNFT